MDKREQKQTFAEILREVESAPVEETTLQPGLYPDDVFVDREGRSYHLVQQELSEDAAHRAVTAGASVVWDRCGCGGDCGFEWYSTDGVSLMAAWGRPDIRRKRSPRGSISEWHSEDGAVLLVAEGSVRWADFMA